MSFSLAHLSDLHLPPQPQARSLRQFSGKRALAVLSWRHKRHHIHTLRPAAALEADLATHAPDHIALTGDLTNFGHPAEFTAVGNYLDRFGPADRLSVIPGNHDLTAREPWQASLGKWQPWLSGDMGTQAAAQDPFPFLRRRGPLAIIGLSSALPTPIFCAAGELGQSQRDRLAALLDQTRAEGLFRVVLIHHPPLMGHGGPRKALRDRDALCEVLQAHGAELVLTGHHHVTQLQAVKGPKGPIPVFAVPAALASVADPELAGWHLHRITQHGNGWRLVTRLRRYDPIADRFRPAGDWSMEIPAAQ